MLSLNFSPALPHTLRSELCPPLQPLLGSHTGQGSLPPFTHTRIPVKLCRPLLPHMEQIWSQLASGMSSPKKLWAHSLLFAKKERPERAGLCSTGCAVPEHPRGTGRLESGGFTPGSAELGGRAECQHLRPPVTPAPAAASRGAATRTDPAGTQAALPDARRENQALLGLPEESQRCEPSSKQTAAF